MRILFDQGTPLPARHFLSHHAVSLSSELGWDQFQNGELLLAAERAGFDLLLTTDKNLRYHKNLKERSIPIVVIGYSHCHTLRQLILRVVAAVDSAIPGSYLEVGVPWGRRRREEA